MKTITAYAIIKASPIYQPLRITDRRLPLFWIKEVAEAECPRNYKVIEVVVSESKTGETK